MVKELHQDVEAPSAPLLIRHCNRKQSMPRMNSLPFQDRCVKGIVETRRTRRDSFKRNRNCIAFICVPDNHQSTWTMWFKTITIFALIISTTSKKLVGLYARLFAFSFDNNSTIVRCHFFTRITKMSLSHISFFYVCTMYDTLQV